MNLLTRVISTTMSLKTFFLTITIALVTMACTSQNKGIIAKKAQLTLVKADYDFTEGPAADKQGNIYFTDQPNDRILKWNAADNAISEYMKPSGRSNGLYVDHEGNLLSAADENNQIWKINNGKKTAILVDSFDSKKLNGPNDLWLDPKGGIYFTDPYYQRPWWSHNEPQQAAARVYYLAPNTNKPIVVADDNFIQPNGIIGTPDGKNLYIADIGAKKTYKYTITPDGSLSNKKLFTDKGSDGMTIDNLGNLYLTGDGVTVFNSDGEQIEQIEIPQDWTANVTFGGKDQKTLFITALNSVYTLQMNVHGVRY